MDKPASLEEIKLIISHLKGNAAPSSDGFTTEFYKTLMEELSPVLQILYNKILCTKDVPHTWKETKFILIPKPNRDPKGIESYLLTIALLNTDYKILAAIFAS